MSRTTEVMKEHLRIAEKYIKAIDESKSKADYMLAINTCKEEVLEQYADLEEIADDFAEKITGNKDKELHEISEKTGDIFGSKITGYYGKMAPYMADADFIQALAEFDKVIGSNPLFGESQFGEDVALQVSTAMAGGMDKIATQMIADTTEPDTDFVEKIAGLINDFADLSGRYVAKLEEAGTARKVVTATDSYVSSIEKMIPDMKQNTDQLKLLMARKEKPEQITEAADRLKKILGDDLKAAMQNKNDLLSEPKVKKAVAKLGEILNKVPF